MNKGKVEPRLSCIPSIRKGPKGEMGGVCVINRL
jgi:hypothetical protein